MKLPNNIKVPSQSSKDPIEVSLAKWLTHKKAAKQGKNCGGNIFYESDQKITEFYGFPNLFENLEDLSNSMCHEVCAWVVKKNKIPSAGSRDFTEKKYGRWICGRRMAKKNNGKKGIGIFYESDHKIAESYGFTDIFEIRDLEKSSNELCHDICKWIKVNNKYPDMKSTDPIEKKYGTWLQTRKKVKINNGNKKEIGIFYASNQIIADSYGLNNLFEIKIPEESSNTLCHEICRWIALTHKYPSAGSTNPIEKKYGVWISRKKKAKVFKGKGMCLFYDSDQKIAVSYGYRDLFQTLEEYSNMLCHEACNWIKVNDKYPNRRSTDLIEKKYGVWLSIRRNSLKGGDKGHFYPSDQAIAESCGYPDLFKTKI